MIKVKSLATDEIGFNEALAAAGIHAVETDLAELIVQLADDTSSHILVPAIHRNRAEIRELFAAELGDGRASTDDPERAGRGRARAPAREVPLASRWASAGRTSRSPRPGRSASWSPRATGGCAPTLPEVLITVMGIEKLVPTWQDLEVFLQLLPRSSTGERMNPYTSFWTGVREGDGPREFHLVLLDNGRTDVAGRRGRPPDAALHPLPRLPERLPGLRARGRPRLRVGLPGADRGDPHAPAARARARPARCPTPPACAAPATRCARWRSTSREVLVHLRGRVVEETGSRAIPSTPACAALALGVLPRRCATSAPSAWRAPRQRRRSRACPGR